MTRRVSRRVVVTGAGVVSAIGVGRDAFWRGLESAASGVGAVQTFDARSFPTHVVAEVPPFAPPDDPLWTTLPEAEAPALRRDRKSLFGLVAGREALRVAFGAGRPRDHYEAHRVGVWLAAGLEVFNLGDLAPHVGGGGLDVAGVLADLDAAPPGGAMQIPAHVGARALAQEAGALGPFSVNLSACAAATQAIGEAFRAVSDGLCDAVLTGGYDSMANPLGLGGFCMLGALTTSNERGASASRPFDRSRDGFVLGEGAAVFVLEEREAALRRGATPLAEVLGYGTTMDGYRVTDPDPTCAGAIGAIRGALADARLVPEAIDYVNAHGTGTRKNDPAETRALGAVFGERLATLPVSSTKSQLGHCIGAAGAVELMAGLFALERQLLPATINLTDPDPECALDHVAGTPRPARVRRVLSNSFGFGGQNAALVVGEP